MTTITPTEEITEALTRALMRPGDAHLTDGKFNINAAEREALHAAQHRLDMQQQAVVECLYRANMSVAETAEYLLLSPAIITSVRDNALDIMRAALPEGRRGIVPSNQFDFVPLHSRRGGRQRRAYSEAEENAYAYFTVDPDASVGTVVKLFKLHNERARIIKKRWEEEHGAKTYPQRLEEARIWYQAQPVPKPNNNIICRKFHLKFADGKRVSQERIVTQHVRQVVRAAKGTRKAQFFAYFETHVSDGKLDMTQAMADLGANSKQHIYNNLSEWRKLQKGAIVEAAAPTETTEPTASETLPPPVAVEEAPLAVPVVSELMRKNYYEQQYTLCLEYEEMLEQHQTILEDKLRRLQTDITNAQVRTAAAKDLAERHYAMHHGVVGSI